MFTSAWQLIASSRATWSLHRWDVDVRQLRHLATSSHGAVDDSGPRYGRVIWGSMTAYRAAAIAWDWRELRPGVFVMADPMSVQSNIEWLDDDGQALEDASRIVWLNHVIYQLPWQQSMVVPRPRRVSAHRSLPASGGAQALLAHAGRPPGEGACAARLRRHVKALQHDR